MSLIFRLLRRWVNWADFASVQGSKSPARQVERRGDVLQRSKERARVVFRGDEPVAAVERGRAIVDGLYDNGPSADLQCPRYTAAEGVREQGSAEPDPTVVEIDGQLTQ